MECRSFKPHRKGNKGANTDYCPGTYNGQTGGWSVEKYEFKVIRSSKATPRKRCAIRETLGGPGVAGRTRRALRCRSWAMKAPRPSVRAQRLCQSVSVYTTISHYSSFAVHLWHATRRSHGFGNLEKTRRLQSTPWDSQGGRAAYVLLREESLCGSWCRVWYSAQYSGLQIICASEPVEGQCAEPWSKVFATTHSPTHSDTSGC